MCQWGGGSLWQVGADTVGLHVFAFRRKPANLTADIYIWIHAWWWWWWIIVKFDSVPGTTSVVGVSLLEDGFAPVSLPDVTRLCAGKTHAWIIPPKAYFVFVLTEDDTLTWFTVHGRLWSLQLQRRARNVIFSQDLRRANIYDISTNVWISVARDSLAMDHWDVW